MHFRHSERHPQSGIKGAVRIRVAYLSVIQGFFSFYFPLNVHNRFGVPIVTVVIYRNNNKICFKLFSAKPPQAVLPTFPHYTSQNSWICHYGRTAICNIMAKTVISYIFKEVLLNVERNDHCGVRSTYST